MEIKPIELAECPAPVRLAAFLLTLVLLWLPIAAPIYILSRDANLTTILTMGILFVEFLALLKFWGWKVYRRKQSLKSYGLVRTRQNALEFLKGLDIGLLFVSILFAVEGLLGWVVWVGSDRSAVIILEGFISALGIAFAEELVFRGWLLDELQRDYRSGEALWANATIFAGLHFVKPPMEILRTLSGFPALLLFGSIMVWAKRRSQGRLGLSIGLHAGLVWGYYVISVGKLVEYSDRVPEWITGINGNPLAGMMGLMFLGVLAFWIRQNKFVT